MPAKLPGALRLCASLPAGDLCPHPPPASLAVQGFLAEADLDHGGGGGCQLSLLPFLGSLSTSGGRLSLRT